MATLLEQTNRVLRRLREESVANLTLPYSKLIAEFVIDTCEELSDYPWEANDATESIATVAGTSQYVIPNTNFKSQLIYLADGSPAVRVDDEDITQTEWAWLERKALDDDTQVRIPQYFAITHASEVAGVAANREELAIMIWPPPSESGLFIRVQHNTPQVGLTVEDDEDTEILYPTRIVTLGALMLALNERGEEIGEPGNIAERRYYTALSGALESEVRNQERRGFGTWYRD